MEISDIGKSYVPYRALTKEGNMIYGYIVPIDGTMRIIPVIGPNYNNIQWQDGIEYSINCEYEINNDTLCRNTGKLDSYNNPIFEHDILLDELNGSYYEVCMWDDLSAWMADYGQEIGSFYLQSIISGKCKVVGNIFDPDSVGYKEFQIQCRQ